MPWLPDSDCARPEQLVEHRRDVAAVHVPWGPFVRGAADNRSDDAVGLDLHAHGRRERVRQPHQRAVVERTGGVARWAGLGDPGEEMVLRIRAEPGRDLLEVVGHAVEDLERSRRGDKALDHAAQRVGETSDLRSALRRLVRRKVRPREGHRSSVSKSTINGAWSEGSLPFRALRSMSAHRDRSASGLLASMRSMRIPRCLWKLPAR